MLNDGLGGDYMNRKSENLELLNRIILLFSIEKIKIQDLSTLIIFMCFLNISTIFLYLLSKPVILLLTIIVNSVLMIYKNIVNLTNGVNQIYIGESFKDNTYITYLKFCLVDFFPFVMFTVLCSFLIVFMLILFKKSKTIFKINFSLITYMMLMLWAYHWLINPLILMVTLLTIVFLFKPIGSGFYFTRLKEIYYIYEIAQIERMFSKKVIWFLIVLSLIFTVIFHQLIPQLSLIVPITIIIAILILILSNNQKCESSILLIKLIVYIIFVPIVIIYNGQNDLTILSILMTTILVYFSIERIISIFKEINKDLIKNSVSYNYSEINDKKIIIENLLSLEVLKYCTIKEGRFINQIIYYFRIENNKDCKFLIKLYLNNYKIRNYHNLAIFILYLIDFKNVVTEKECYKFLKNNIIIDNQLLNPIELIEEYLWLVNVYDINSQKMLEIFDYSWIHLTGEGKQLYANILEERGEIAKANLVRSNI